MIDKVAGSSKNQSWTNGIAGDTVKKLSPEAM